jgi:hypothetical protein
MSEDELTKQYKPGLALRRLRTSWWLEYDRLQEHYLQHHLSKAKFDIERAIQSVCTKKYFLDSVVDKDNALGYILRPPAAYIVCVEEALQHGVDRLREILNLPLYKPRMSARGAYIKDGDGNPQMEPDHKTIDIVLKAFAMLDLRAKGAIAQKLNIEGMLQQKNVNVNVAANGNRRVTTVDVDALEQKVLSIDDLDEKLNLLTRETKLIMEDPKLLGDERLRLKKIESDSLAERLQNVSK